MVVFFLCSGFIIPVSLERQGSLRRFWIRRLLRRYPLYWLSVVLCMLCALAGVGPFARAIVARPIGVFLLPLALIFVGIIFYRIHQGTIGWASAAGVLALAVIMLAAQLFGSRDALAEQLPFFFVHRFFALRGEKTMYKG